ncbi:TPA: YdbL family protein [Proteus mirabilis]|uniref:YdbL family protein n=1 Tax=Proteus mirabilis TaxID=584 RepID=UPI0018C6CD11|nr:YdbL family protein [Proteus mirabilis]HDT0719484.1 YdbL family protein [Proteus mirabilis]HEJ9436939.1 YdbL family protein [Proteus mirabilis]HEK1717895.1 YdbL family protein [Proteus mirabilis]HEK2723277.1 YdbL family protein [Proteus mirabilis]
MNYKKYLFSFALMITLISSSAVALTLDEARAQGLVGETFSGYLELVQPNHKQAQILVNEINQVRKAKYAEIAKTNQVTPESVARLAGEKLVARANSGEFVKGINGQWIKK